MLGNYRVERAPPVSDTGAPPPVSNTPTPQIDPTSIMLGNYRVERAPTAPSGVTASSSVGFASFASKPGFVAATANSSTTESKPDTNTTLNVFNTLGNDRVERASPVSDSTGRSDSANPEVNADLPDPTSFSLGDHVVSRPTTDASEPSRQSDSSTQSKPTSALQQKQWSQVPPPKPRPGNAQLPQHQAAIEQARNVADKFKPFRPSNLRNMIQLSPSEKEKENAGLTSLEIPQFSNEVLAAVMAVPDEMVYPFRKVKAVPSVEEVVRNGLDWFS
ncbi:hypothetical protein B7494_g5453 [Chlorociboria aeruginascens]|nr:hypothetical protein B7494_g5453 [Chlorociboria aeruginascens]